MLSRWVRGRITLHTHTGLSAGGWVRQRLTRQRVQYPSLCGRRGQPSWSIRHLPPFWKTRWSQYWVGINKTVHSCWLQRQQGLQWIINLPLKEKKEAKSIPDHLLCSWWKHTSSTGVHQHLQRGHLKGDTGFSMFMARPMSPGHTCGGCNEKNPWWCMYASPVWSVVLPAAT